MGLGCIGLTATIYINRELRPVLKYGHLHTVPRVALLQALYCIYKAWFKMQKETLPKMLTVTTICLQTFNIKTYIIV